MINRDDPFRLPASPLGILQRLVPAARNEEPGPRVSDFLKGADSAPAANSAPTVDDTDPNRDPAREAAMNRIRRMRIRAA